MGLAHCPKSLPEVQDVFLLAAVKRRWRSRHCCCRLFPRLPPPQPPSKLPSSSRPSLPNRGLVESTSAGSPLSTHFPLRSASARKWASSTKKILAPRLLGLLSDLAVLEDEGFPRFILGFQEAFLGSLQHEAQPMEVVQATAGRLTPRSKLCLRNCLTTFQFQLDNSTPASPGGFCTADFSWFC